MFIFIKANPIKILQENNTIIDLITFSILSLFIRWIKLYKKNINEEVIRKYRNDDISIASTLNKFIKTTLNSDGITELIILSYLIQIPILVYNNFAKLEYIFLQGPVEISEKTIKKFSDPETISNKIVLKFAFSSKIKNIPQTIYSIYY